MSTWNRSRPVLLVAFALMIVVRAQRSFPDDGLLHQQVQAEVAKELAKEERFQNLRVDGEGHTLKLRGTVALLEDKRQAIERVAEMKDVRAVVSLIKVETEKVADGLLLKQLRERLAEQENTQVNVKVKNGVVTIEGTVQHNVHRERVLSTVAGTSGVIGMKDLLKVAAD
jgi:osmotically-inducible protein OsmY